MNFKTPQRKVKFCLVWRDSEPIYYLEHFGEVALSPAEMKTSDNVKFSTSDGNEREISIWQSGIEEGRSGCVETPQCCNYYNYNDIKFPVEPQYFPS